MSYSVVSVAQFNNRLVSGRILRMTETPLYKTEASRSRVFFSTPDVHYFLPVAVFLFKDHLHIYKL